MNTTTTLSSAISVFRPLACDLTARVLGGIKHRPEPLAWQGDRTSPAFLRGQTRLRVGAGRGIRGPERPANLIRLMSVFEAARSDFTRTPRLRFTPPVEEQQTDNAKRDHDDRGRLRRHGEIDRAACVDPRIVAVNGVKTAPGEPADFGPPYGLLLVGIVRHPPNR
jgi:hypothetical protein